MSLLVSSCMPRNYYQVINNWIEDDEKLTFNDAELNFVFLPSRYTTRLGESLKSPYTLVLSADGKENHKSMTVHSFALVLSDKNRNEKIVSQQYPEVTKFFEMITVHSNLKITLLNNIDITFDRDTQITLILDLSVEMINGESYRGVVKRNFKPLANLDIDSPVLSSPLLQYLYSTDK